MKLGTRRTGENKNVLNNGITYMCFISMLRLLLSHMRLAIVPNLEGKSCDLSNEWSVLVRRLAACSPDGLHLSPAGSRPCFVPIYSLYRAALFQAVRCHTGMSVTFSRPGRQRCFRLSGATQVCLSHSLDLAGNAVSEPPLSKLEVHLLSPVPHTWKPPIGFWVVSGARGMMWSHVPQYWPLIHCLVVFGTRGTMWSHVLYNWPLVHWLVVFGARGSVWSPFLYNWPRIHCLVVWC